MWYGLSASQNSLELAYHSDPPVRLAIPSRGYKLSLNTVGRTWPTRMFGSTHPQFSLRSMLKLKGNVSALSSTPPWPLTPDAVRSCAPPLFLTSFDLAAVML